MNRLGSSALLGILALTALTMVGTADAACDTFGPIREDPTGDTQPLNLAGHDITKLQACYDTAAEEYIYSITVAAVPGQLLQGVWYVDIGYKRNGFTTVAEVYGGTAGYQFRLLSWFQFGYRWYCEGSIKGSLAGKTFRLRVPKSELADHIHYDPIDPLFDYEGAAGFYLVPPATVCGHAVDDTRLPFVVKSDTAS